MNINRIEKNQIQCILLEHFYSHFTATALYSLSLWQMNFLPFAGLYRFELKLKIIEKRAAQILYKQQQQQYAI